MPTIRGGRLWNIGGTAGLLSGRCSTGGQVGPGAGGAVKLVLKTVAR